MFLSFIKKVTSVASSESVAGRLFLESYRTATLQTWSPSRRAQSLMMRLSNLGVFWAVAPIHSSFAPGWIPRFFKKARYAEKSFLAARDFAPAGPCTKNSPKSSAKTRKFFSFPAFESLATHPSFFILVSRDASCGNWAAAFLARSSASRSTSIRSKRTFRVLVA